jgi:hypothetical protein
VKRSEIGKKADADLLKEGYDPVNGPQGATVSEAWAQVVETIYSVDVVQEFARLQDNLQMGEDRSDYLTVLRHIDRAETNARMAHKLALSARKERIRFESNNERVSAELRDGAYRSLQSEKDAGERSKAITDGDVKSRMHTLFPDEVTAQELLREQVKGMEEHCEHLVTVWMSRCRTLNTILQTLRK